MIGNRRSCLGWQLSCGCFMCGWGTIRVTAQGVDVKSSHSCVCLKSSVWGMVGMQGTVKGCQRRRGGGGCRQARRVSSTVGTWLPHPQVGDSGTQRPAAAGFSTAGLGSRVDYREPLRLQDPFLEFLQASWINGWRVRGWA